MSIFGDDCKDNVPWFLRVLGIDKMPPIRESAFPGRRLPHLPGKMSLLRITLSQPSLDRSHLQLPKFLHLL